MAMILIAEDEFLLADVLGFILEDEGHTVIKASHGRAALAAIEKSVPDLVITDFMMPLMTGLELALAIRAKPELERLPIILVSGAQGKIGREHPEAFDAVIDKPYYPEVLLKRVAELLTEGRKSKAGD